MPELPEVEAARRAIEDHCSGKKIKKAIIANDSKVIEGVSPSDFENALVGKTLISAHRKGKNLWLHLDSPPFPSFQFGMAGAIYIKGIAVTKYKRSAVNDTDEWPSKYSKFFIEPASVPPISELGPDALLEPMTVDNFYEYLSKKKLAIKALLLDQSFISGIGNWVADEVLYQARIHPQQIASSLSKESCATLHKCIKEVIEKAVEVGADSTQFPSNWIFHSREKKPGKAFVDGKKIDFIKAGGRTTAYVPELQKLGGGQAANAVDKPKRQTLKKKKDEDNDEGDGSEDDVNELAIKEEETVKKVKSKRELKPRGHGKQPPAKRKHIPSDDSNDEEDDSDTAHDNDGGGDEENQKKKPRKVTKGKQAKAKKVINQKSKKPKAAN